MAWNQTVEVEYHYGDTYYQSSGTVIDGNTILTAAHCVTDSNGNYLSNRNYKLKIFYRDAFERRREFTGFDQHYDQIYDKSIFDGDNYFYRNESKNDVAVISLFSNGAESSLSQYTNGYLGINYTQKPSDILSKYLLFHAGGYPAETFDGDTYLSKYVSPTVYDEYSCATASWWYAEPGTSGSPLLGIKLGQQEILGWLSTVSTFRSYSTYGLFTKGTYDWVTYQKDYNPYAITTTTTTTTTSSSTTFRSSHDVTAAEDGETIYRRVASDDNIISANPDGSWSFDGSTATGSGERDVLFLGADRGSLKSILGGAGDDVYVVSWWNASTTSGDTRIVENADGGDDSCWVNFSDYILPNQVENLVSMSSDGIRMLANDSDNKFIGGGGADQLYAGTGDDIIYGREGDDVIIGGSGADAMWGCEGADSFVYETDHLGGVDKIWDFAVGVDKIIVSQAVLDRTWYETTTGGSNLYYDANGDHAYDGTVDRLITGLAGVNVTSGTLSNIVFVS